MSSSKNQTVEGRRRNKHSLFANTFDPDTVSWKPGHGSRRKSRVPRQEIGEQIGRARQLRSFTSWRDMKKALDLPDKTHPEDIPDEEENGGCSRSLQVRLEPARLSLPPQYQQRQPTQRPLSLLFLKEKDGDGDQRHYRLDNSKTTRWRFGLLTHFIAISTFIFFYVYMLKPMLEKINKYSQN